MRIAIVVHGRFHAFDLARALIERGNDVTIFTNYPVWAVTRFGIAGDRVRSFVIHGVLSRIALWVGSRIGWSADPLLHPVFSRWARKALAREHFDVIHAWTGVAEEIYKDPLHTRCLKLEMRGSAHIRTQARLLSEESVRVGQPVDHPSSWMVEREEREYQLADFVIVLSRFALRSFIAEGYPPERLRFLPLGTELTVFRPPDEIAEQRQARILSGAPLRVLYVGGVTWQKGFHDLCRMIELSAGRHEFRIVGPVSHEAGTAANELRSHATLISKRPQSELPEEYAWGDIFVFPTIQDGYAVVIAQASAAGLPILTTTNCCGPDLIEEGRTGFILPIRSPEAFFEKLDWCDRNRAELARMAGFCHTEFRPRDWNDVAADFEVICSSNSGRARGGEADV